MTYPIIISTLSFFCSCIALYFTFKRDTHRIRASQKTIRNRHIDTVTVNNDSGFAVNVSAIGHINHRGNIIWLDDVSNASTGGYIKFPIVIDARSALSSIITHNIHTFPQGKVYGFCIQLACGRTSVTVGNLPRKLALNLRIREVLSWLSSGKIGFPINDVQYKPYIS